MLSNEILISPKSVCLKTCSTMNFYVHYLHFDDLYDDDVEQMYFTNDYMIYLFSNSSIKYENTMMDNL